MNNLKFAFIEQEHAFFKEAFKSNDYNNLIHYDFCCIYDFYKNYIYIIVHILIIK